MMRKPLPQRPRRLLLGRLRPPRLEYDCPEGDARGIAAERARHRHGEGVDHPVGVDVALAIRRVVGRRKRGFG